MKKILPVLFIASLMVSCNKPMGELVGQGNKGSFRDANPYGMVYVKAGSFIMGPNDQSVFGEVGEQRCLLGRQLAGNFGDDFVEGAGILRLAIHLTNAFSQRDHLATHGFTLCFGDVELGNAGGEQSSQSAQNDAAFALQAQ